MNGTASAKDDKLAEYMAAVSKFVDEQVAPRARETDESETTSRALLAVLRASGYLSAALPTEWGGGGIDPIAYGLATEEFGRACSSIRSLLTVHNMSSQAISCMGTADQRKKWLPALCSGEAIVAFALTEESGGSSVDSVKTLVRDCGNEYELTGSKKWITYGQIADLFLVFGKCDGRPVSLVLERDAPGVSIVPVKGVLGTRGALLAELRFNGVRVDKSHQIGALGAGFNFVANMAIDHGRFSVAWGCVGIIRACLDASLAYTSNQNRGSQRLSDHQLVRRLLSDMLVSYRAAREVCLHAARLRWRRDPRAANETSLAKYLASTSAVKAASDALHLHGADGCSPDFPVARWLRDANVMTIIEGTSEIHQIALANYALQRPYRSFIPDS